MIEFTAIFDAKKYQYFRIDIKPFIYGGQGWIRTIVGVSQQIYSLPPLATRAPTQI